MQRVFIVMTGQLRPKFSRRVRVHSNLPIHSLLTLQSRCPRGILSSPDRLHRMLLIRSQNRGTSRSGLIDVLTSYTEDSPKAKHRATASRDPMPLPLEVLSKENDSKTQWTSFGYHNASVELQPEDSAFRCFLRGV
jgi:hypothetical protein